MYVSGVTGGLYYVRNGTVNDYALTFNLPLRPDIADIYFSWNASASQSPVKHTRCRCVHLHYAVRLKLIT